MKKVSHFFDDSPFLFLSIPIFYFIIIINKVFLR